ncbi:hypothetical protein SAY87_000833 [Trapa incisa]|uniref:Protein ELC-like n=1 Tax=Trapa incisa TaxID=236973 RepID=A0AAN7GNP8_9MYRT|nr:hypothetical protein SAY87_000833 [Trapa incisa]
MAPIAPIQFIEAALSNGFNSPFALSYSDPSQIWAIRKDLLSLLHEFPSFSPSMDTFHHVDGSSANLLVARGCLRLRGSASPVPITIWLHENYPQSPPMVFVDPTPGSTIHRGHPFVDYSSGFTITPYLETWAHPRCSLSDLARNLIKVFSKDHPFFSPPPSSSSGSLRVALASKNEAMDRLSGMILYDISALRSRGDEEVEDLLWLQGELQERAAVVSRTVRGLENERACLEARVRELELAAERLSDWLEGLELRSRDMDAADGIDGVFEAADEESSLRLEFRAGELAIDDTIYALDRAIDEEILSSDAYIKQVRALAREQFGFMAMRMRLDHITFP